MNKFIKENLWLLLTFSLALVSGNLIYRFYFIPKILDGENTAWLEVSILPVVLSFLYWGAKSDSWQKLLSFSFIISALVTSYLDIMVRFRFNDTRGLDATPEYGVFGLYGILVFALFFSVILGIIRLLFYGGRELIREIQMKST